MCQFTDAVVDELGEDSASGLTAGGQQHRVLSEASVHSTGVSWNICQINPMHYTPALYTQTIQGMRSDSPTVHFHSNTTIQMTRLKIQQSDR